MSEDRTFDVVIIGGGINGTAIARDAAGRGLSVLLCEKNDIASATSSASTKLIHGGLRYLEHYEFRLVREALAEREVLLRTAPHIVSPLRFVLPHDKSQRPAWMIRMGLFLYDRLGGKISLPKSHQVRFSGHPLGKALKKDFTKGFAYSDCWVDDARFAVLNAVDAAAQGGLVLTRTKVTGLTALPGDGLWQVDIKEQGTGQVGQAFARVIVNAAGPWVDPIESMIAPGFGDYTLRLVKGSHIVVPRLYDGAHAYILQNTDHRIVFAIPYEKDYTLIGTTEVEYDGDPAQAQIAPEETQYLCDAVNRFFKEQIKPKDVVWSFSGVRPLVYAGNEEADEVSRDYILDFERHEGLPVLSVYSGKITTSRHLAEEAVNRLEEVFDELSEPWTENEPLPGGDLNTADYKTFFKTFRQEYNWLPEDTAKRYARNYGSRARGIVKSARNTGDLGVDCGDGVFEAELVYLIKCEWARSVEDVIWRRTKLGLHITDETRQNIETVMAKYLDEDIRETSFG